MARQYSESCPYKSFYAEDTWVTPAQYIAEGMVARQAKKEGITLPHHFWNTTRWKRTFMVQLRFANSLLKLYSPEAIIRVLRTQKNTFSLGAKWLDPLFQVENDRLATQAKNRQEAVIAETPTIASPANNEPEKPRPVFVKKPSLKDKLKDL